MASQSNDPFKEEAPARRAPRKAPIRIDWKQVAGRLAEGMSAEAAAAAAGITEEHLWRHLHASGRFRYWLEQAVERRRQLADLQLGVAGRQALLARALQPAGLDAGLLAVLQAEAGDHAEAGTPAGPPRPPADRSPAAAASGAGSKVKRQVARLGTISGTAGNMARLARRAAADRAALDRIQREKNMVVQLLSQSMPREHLDAAKQRLLERRAAHAAATAAAEQGAAGTGEAERSPPKASEAPRSPAKAGEAPRSPVNANEAPRSPANAGEAEQSQAKTADAPAMPPDPDAPAVPAGRLKGYPTYWWSADPWNGSKRPWPRPGEPFPPEDSAPEPAAPE